MPLTIILPAVTDLASLAKALDAAGDYLKSVAAAIAAVAPPATDGTTEPTARAARGR